MTEHHDSSPADPVNVSSAPEDVEKVQSMMESMDIAMLTTTDSSSLDHRLTSRPLSTQVAEDDGDVLFLVRRSSAVARDIAANPQVNVAYSSSKAWVSLAGTAQIVEDRALIEQLWSKGADMFMEGGPENPDNVILKVSGDTATYWGGESLIGTAVKTIRAMRSSKEEQDKDGEDAGGPTVVELP